MKGKIGLEEHFATGETLNDSKGFLGDHVWPELEKRLLDLNDYRLSQMDRHGMQMMILSLNAPAVQAVFDVRKAKGTATRADDAVAHAGGAEPGRGHGPRPLRNPQARPGGRHVPRL